MRTLIFTCLCLLLSQFATGQNQPPIAVCNDIIEIDFGAANQIRLDDIDNGSRDDETDTNNLIRSLTLVTDTTLNPSDAGFMAVDFIEITSDDVCDTKIVALHVWDEEGLMNTCWTQVNITDPLSFCAFRDETRCYSFDQGQCATDEFAGLIDINGSVEEMASQMKSYLESKSFAVNEVRVEKNFHEAACEACGICPEPHRFFVEIFSGQQDAFEALDFLNTEMTDCNLFVRAEVQEGEIPLFINLSDVSKDENVIRFSLNGDEATIYDHATFGLPISSLVSGTNELSIENSKGSILNGISTLDIVMTLQYVLGLESLMPTQIIAADIDKSGDVSLTKDITKMSNLVLGIDNSIEGSNWFFIPESEAFGQPFDFDGFDFVNNYSTYQFSDTDINSETGINVDVYKYGDLNRSTAFNRSNEEAIIRYDDIELTNDEIHDIQFSLSSENDIQFLGAQAAIDFDNVEILELSHDYGTAFNYVISDHTVTFSFASGEEYQEINFSLKIKSNTQNKVENLISIGENIQTEFILSDLSVSEIGIGTNDITSSTSELNDSAIAIYPNPTSDKINILFPNKTIGELLKIYNTQGQLEYSTMIDKEEMNLNARDLNSKGLKIIHVSGIPSQKFLIH